MAGSDGLLSTFFADLAVHLILGHAWESSLVHHLLAYGEGVENGTVAAMVVLIAIIKLVSLGSESLSVRISVVVGRFAS